MSRREFDGAKMASFVADALLPMGDVRRFKSKDEWIDHYLSLPDEAQEHLETLTHRFLELEDQFLKRAYAYTRSNWESVRPYSA